MQRLPSLFNLTKEDRDLYRTAFYFDPPRSTTTIKRSWRRAGTTSSIETPRPRTRRRQPVMLREATMPPNERKRYAEGHKATPPRSTNTELHPIVATGATIGVNLHLAPWISSAGSQGGHMYSAENSRCSIPWNHKAVIRMSSAWAHR